MILLTEMFSAHDIRNRDPEYFTDLRDELNEECGKYGVVEKVIVDIERLRFFLKSEGNVWIKFGDVESAKKACHYITQRIFNGRKIQCYYIAEGQFYLRFYK